MLRRQSCRVLWVHLWLAILWSTPHFPDTLCVWGSGILSCVCLHHDHTAITVCRCLHVVFVAAVIALQLFTALCRQEVQEVVRLCTSGSYTSLQFVIHSYEVLKALPAAAGVICRPLPHMGCDQAENYTLNYVEVLAGGRSTWLLGAEYLAWCPVYGADALEALLDRSPVSADAVRSLLDENE